MIRRRLTSAGLTLRVWVTGQWIADLAWGIRAGTLAGVFVTVAASQLGWC